MRLLLLHFGGKRAHALGFRAHLSLDNQTGLPSFLPILSVPLTFVYSVSHWSDHPMRCLDRECRIPFLIQANLEIRHFLHDSFDNKLSIL